MVNSMEMEFHLHPEVFDIVSGGIKNVEIRVNDEKRRKLKVGDKLLFLKRPDEVEELSAIIKNLVYFNNFSEVVDKYAMERLYLSNTTKDEYIALMRKFYSDEEVAKYGVVAIEFELINNKYE